LVSKSRLLQDSESCPPTSLECTDQLIDSFGEPGAYIISSFFLHIFGENPGPALAPAIDMKITRVLQYFVVPWVASRLIAQDLKIRTLQACKIMGQTHNYARILYHGVEPQEFDGSIKAAVRAYRAANSGPAASAPSPKRKV
jgi:hypothetical protein